MFKKAIFILFVCTLPVMVFMGCSEDSDDNISKGFITPDRYNINTTCFPGEFKEYGLADKEYVIAGQNSGIGTNRNVIIYAGVVGKATYFAMALDNRHAVSPPNFSVRIFFPFGGSISDSGTDISITSGNYNVQVVQGGSVYTSTTSDLNITVTDLTDYDPIDPCDPIVPTYRVDFNNTIDLGGTSITAGNYIVAQKFPNSYDSE